MYFYGILMTNRPSIPTGLERDVKIEAGHRCAIPTCRCTTVEIAHIVPWNEIKEHKFDNLIALCPNCHALYDRDKKIDQKSMMIYKANLGLLNSRYAEFERRVLQIFCDDSDKETIQLPGWHDIHILYLVKDGLLVKTGINSGCILEGIPSWEEFRLTENGRRFVENLMNKRLIE
jgi:hypothetical protein